MKALVLHGPGDLRLEQVLKPTASPGSVVVRVIASPVWGYVVRCKQDPQYMESKIMTRLAVRSHRRLVRISSSLPANIRNLLRRPY